MKAPASDAPAPDTTLQVRRRIRASPERVFDAWTDPHELARWWGPPDVDCTGVSLDLRVGGAYRIEHRLPDGTPLVIHGTFERIERPHLLRFDWHVEPGPGDRERVTVRFEAVGDETEVSVLHERILREETRTTHRRGWEGCLDGLAAHVAPDA